MNLDVVDQSEVRVTVGDGSCDIISYDNTVISCLPPQSSVGTLDIVVSSHIRQL